MIRSRNATSFLAAFVPKVPVKVSLANTTFPSQFCMLFHLEPKVRTNSCPGCFQCSLFWTVYVCAAGALFCNAQIRLQSVLLTLPSHSRSLWHSKQFIAVVGLVRMSSVKVILPPNEQHQFSTLTVRLSLFHRHISTFIGWLCSCIMLPPLCIPY